MKPPTLVILIFCIFTLVSAGAASALAQPARHELPTVAPQAPVLAPAYIDATLDICIGQEPDSLYLYGSAMLASRQVLDAVYDGPVDQVNQTMQPVILQRLPTAENGGASVAAVTVTAGDRVVAAGGGIVTLAAGAAILPSGCRSTDCAIIYGGGPVLMDRLRATFDLLPGLTWSDGEPLTAQDSVYAFNLNRHPDTPAAQWSQLHAYTALYTATTATQAAWTGLPGHLPLTTLSDYFWNPLPEHVWGAFTPGELLTAEVSARRPLGWGPYVLDDWVAGSHIALHKNPNYFRTAEGLPRFKNLVFHFTTDLVGGLVSGQCDLVPGWFPTSNIPALQTYSDAGLLRLEVAPGSSWEHVDFGIRSSAAYTGFAAQTQAFQDVRVRQAFAYCLDRRAIARAATGAALVPATYVAPDSPYYPPDAAEYPFNPAQGRALLDAAGWVDEDGDGLREKGGAPFSAILSTTDRADRRATANAIAAQMRTNCGIQVIPDPIPGWGLFDPDGPLDTSAFDLAMFAWITNDASACKLYETGGEQNRAGYSNPAFDVACRSFQNAATQAERINFGQTAARIFSQDLPALPLYWFPLAAARAPHITGYVMDPMRLWSLEQIGLGTATQVSAAGGDLAPAGEALVLAFASGAFTTPVTVTYTALAPRNVPQPESLLGTGRFFEIAALAAGGQALQPMGAYTITVGFVDTQVEQVIASTLALYTWDGGAWRKEPTSWLDIIAKNVIATPDHLSLWALLGRSRRTFLPVTLR